MLIRDLLVKQQKKSFVGRKVELRLLYQTLMDTNREWKLQHIYGPSGIGKTTLLRYFADQVGREKCIYIDRQNSFTNPTELLIQLYKKIEQITDTFELSPINLSMDAITQAINHYAITNNGLFIFFDTFEKWRTIEEWLRNEWLPTLHPFVKVCTAGRYPLSGPWLQRGWNLLVRNIKLNPLSATEVKQYAQTNGISNREVIQSLLRFSRGIPLALSMACEIIVRQRSFNFFSNPDQTQIIGTLISELMKDVNNPSFQNYLEAAAMVWRYDQELLSAILKEEVPTQLFREFCQLPFIMINDENWLLHDSIRQWIYSDLINRQPEKYHSYRSRALELFIKREQQFLIKNTDVTIDKLYLHENDFVRDLYFAIEDDLLVREFKAEELPVLEELYRKYLNSISNNDSDLLYLIDLIGPLWKAEPTSILGMWREDKLVAFCTCIPLREETIAILRTSPLVAPAISNYDPCVPHYLICMAGYQPYTEDEISGSVARAFIQLFIKKGLVSILICYPKWIDFLHLLGCERIPWGDTISATGIVHQAYQIDLTAVDYSQKIDRLVSEHSANVTSLSETKLDLKKTEDLIRKVLKNYSRLHLHLDLIVLLRPLLLKMTSDHESEIGPLQLQQQIQYKLEQLSKGSEEEHLMSHIIQLSYIKKIGAHEMIAERLNISVPTYYRYLKRAISRLSYEFIIAASNPLKEV